MTDQTIPADDLRGFIARYRTAANGQGSILLDELEAMLPPPPRPTLADMTDEERAACTGMQADEATGERVVIIDGTDRPDGRVEVLHGEIYVYYPFATNITPRPDLPRLKWPGTEKPAAAPALPDGWRLADHREYGRVLVVRVDGEDAIFGAPFKATGIRTHVGRVADLTFVDTDKEADQ